MRVIASQSHVANRTFSDYVCVRCLSNLSWRLPRQRRKDFRTSSTVSEAGLSSPPCRTLLEQEYFRANGFLPTKPRTSALSLSGAGSRLVSLVRSRARRPATLRYFEQTGASRSSSTRLQDRLSARAPRGGTLSRSRSITPEAPDTGLHIPLDASAQLADVSARSPSRSLRRVLSAYLSLSKPRLSFLIVLTTTAAYSLFPVPAVLLPSATTSPSLSTLTLLFLTTGTALSSASANTLNMLFEPEHDAKMSRTRNRPLVRKLITPQAAALFAALTGATGLGLLLYGVNPTVASLSALNIFLYAGVYTPMKRVSVINTWIGAIVGGIPPLMGWAAAAGQNATGSGGWQELLLGDTSAGGWLLAGLLFAWQFPHFNALSWTIRDEYKNAGYRMLAWTNPKANARISLRYSLLLFPICFGFCWAGVTDRGFLVTSSVVNGWMVREAWRFWRQEGAKGSARGLFWASVWHLPVVLVLAMAHKKGLWDGVWRSLNGREADYDEAWVDDGEADVIKVSPTA